MRDCAYEVSIALSAFCHVAKGHTALTSECGSMLEEVCFSSCVTSVLVNIFICAFECGSSYGLWSGS